MVTTPSHDPRPPRRATSADIAKRAGVSRATVSYILNGKAGVSFTEETREAVRRAARELSYQPNAAARSLVAGSGPIVIVISRLPHNEMTALAAGALTQEFANRGLLTTVLQVSEDIETTISAIAALHPRAALLAFPTRSEIATRLEAEGIEVVAWAPEGAASSLAVLQVEHLRSQGHTRLAFADVADTCRFGVLDRRAEFIEACAEAGLPTPPVGRVSRFGEGAPELVQRWHSGGVTAVGAYNDEVALAVLYGVREAGLRCPEDIAVIGADDIPAGAVAYPPLTTVAFNITRDVTWIVGAILHRLNLADEPAQHGAPQLSITRRAST